MTYLRKLFKCLNFSEKNKIFYCYFLILIASGLEFVSITAIIPMINLIVDRDYQQKFLSFFENDNFSNFFSTDFSFKVILIVILIFILKFLFLTYLSWFRATFNQKLIIRIKDSIFQRYLNQKYIFFLKNHSSKLIRNLSTESNLFVGSINNLISIFLEISILLTMLLLIYLFQPLDSLFIIFSIILLGIIIYIPLKNTLNKWGIIRQKNDADNLKNIQQGIGGIKDIKINKKEEYFLKQFNFTSSQSAKAGKIRSFLMEFPRLWLELIIALSIFISIIFLINQNYSLNEILASLGIYAAVGFRSLSSINRLVVAYQGLAYTKSVVDIIYQELQLEIGVKKIKQNEKLIFKNSIEIKNLSYEYEKNRVISDLNLKIDKKQFLGIVGPSGSGKTTLINLISGLLQLQKGEILVDANKINLNSSEWLELIGYMSQNTYIFDETLEKNISMSEEKIDKEKIDYLIKLVCLDEVANRNDFNINKLNLGEAGSKLSLGQIQRIGIARALYQNPSILILDEATSALDMKLEEKIIINLSKYCREKDMTVILVSHRKKPLEYCNSILNLHIKKIDSNV